MNKLSPAAQAKRDDLAKDRESLRDIYRETMNGDPPYKHEIEFGLKCQEKGFDQGHAFAMQECAVLIDAAELLNNLMKLNLNSAVSLVMRKTIEDRVNKLEQALATFKSNNQAGEQGGEG